MPRSLSIIAIALVLLGCKRPVTSESSSVSTLVTPAGAAPEVGSRFVRRVAPASASAIVFVHGIFGDSTTTWTNARAGAYWPKLLAADKKFDGTSIYVYEYPTPKLRQTLSVDELAENLRLTLSNDGVLEHKDVIFLCHSMGGLVTRALLLKYRDIAAKVRFVYFYSTPNTGSPVAKLAAIVSKNPQLGNMYPLREDAYLGSLQSSWLAANFAIPCFCAYETRDTSGIRVVERESATNLCNRRLDPIDADHLMIVKPASDRDISYMSFSEAFRVTPQLGDAPIQNDSDVKVVDASVSYDKIDDGHLHPVIDLKLRNVGGKPAFLKRVTPVVIASATFEDCNQPQYMLVKESVTYDLDIESADGIATSNSIPPNDVDRIKFRVGRAEGGPTLTVYKVKLRLVIDESSRAIDTSPFLVKLVGPQVPVASSVLGVSEKDWNACVERNLVAFRNVGYKVYKDRD